MSGYVAYYNFRTMVEITEILCEIHPEKGFRLLRFEITPVDSKYCLKAFFVK